MSNCSYKGEFLPLPANADKYLDSLSYFSFNDTEAFLEFIDNSLDAQATDIYLDIELSTDKEVSKYVISDNGIGMSKDVLIESMREGNDRKRNRSRELGYFGMGMKTAFVGIAKTLTILSKPNGDLNKITYDINRMEGNRIGVWLNKATDEDINIFDKYTRQSKTGTVVIIENLRNPEYPKRVKDFENHLFAELGRIYRKFILSGRNIFVNDQKCDSRDPLHWDHELVKQYTSYTVPILGEEVKVKIAIMPHKDEYDRKNHPKTMRSGQEFEGVYVLRNNREIVSAMKYPFYTSLGGRSSRIRIEVSITGTLDRLFNVSFARRNINPDKDLVKALKIRENVSEIGSNHNNWNSDVDCEEDVSKKIDADTTSKLPLLIGSKKSSDKIESKSKNSDSDSGSGKNSQYTTSSKDNSMVARLGLNSVCTTYESHTPDAPIFHWLINGADLVCQINTDHVFYQNFVHGNSIPFVKMFHSLALAEYDAKINNEELAANLRQTRVDYSITLRKLVN